MLILNRREDETVTIGENIEVTILSIHGTQVRIGITAPREIAVHRKEVYLRIQAEQEAVK